MRPIQPSRLEEALALPWAVINAHQRCLINQRQASPLLVARYRHQWLWDGRQFRSGWIYSWRTHTAGPSSPMQ